MRIIQGQWRGRIIDAPPGTLTRPTSDRLRGTIFNTLYSILARRGQTFENLLVLDLFAGSGALSFEALSRGVKHTTMVDQNPNAYRCILQTIKKLQAADRCLPLRADVLSLRVPDHPYDLIFLDPPYGQGLPRRTLDKLKSDRFCVPSGLVVVETAAREDLSPLKETWTVLSHRQAGRSAIWILEYTSSSQNDH